MELLNPCREIYRRPDEVRSLSGFYPPPTANIVILNAMTTSNDRLDRIEALVEQNAEAIERNASAIDKLTDDLGRFNQRLDDAVGLCSADFGDGGTGGECHGLFGQALVAQLR
jgi:hypothetical protein